MFDAGGDFGAGTFITPERQVPSPIAAVPFSGEGGDPREFLRLPGIATARRPRTNGGDGWTASRTMPLRYHTVLPAIPGIPLAMAA